MRQGYTKKVLKAQIRKYEKLIAGSDAKIETWLTTEFNESYYCPICYYRSEIIHGYCSSGRFEKCLAINKTNVVCENQAWFKKLKRMKFYLQGSYVKQLRQILKTRLKYWQLIYKEKYPEGL